MAGGGFETKEAAAARIAKQQANQKKKQQQAPALGEPPAATAPQQQQQQRLPAAVEKKEAPRPGQIVTPNANPGSRMDEILKDMGVQSAKDARGLYVPPDQRTNVPKEIVVTMFDVIPEEIQGAFEKLLGAGITACLLFFLASGISIGLEAYAVSTKTPLAPEIDQVIVNILEPAFTPSLLVTLGLSSILGIFKIGQLSKAGVNYKE